MDLDARHAIHDHQCGVGRDQSRFRVVEKDIEARSVDEIDFLFGPFGESQSGGDGQLALNFLIVEIGDGRAFIHPRQAIGSPGRIQKSGRQGGLAAMSVTNEGDVSNLRTFVYFHSVTLQIEISRRMLSH